MLVMTKETPTFTDRDELVQPAMRIRWAPEAEAASAVTIPAVDEVAGWRRAVEASGGRMASAAELEQSGL